MVTTPECPAGPTLEKLSFFSLSEQNFLEIHIPMYSFRWNCHSAKYHLLSSCGSKRKQTLLYSDSKEKLQLTKVKPTKQHYHTGSGAAWKDDEEVLRNGMPEKNLITSVGNLGNSSHNVSISHIGIFTHQLKFCHWKRSKPGDLHCVKEL